MDSIVNLGAVVCCSVHSLNIDIIVLEWSIISFVSRQSIEGDGIVCALWGPPQLQLREFYVSSILIIINRIASSPFNIPATSS